VHRKARSGLPTSEKKIDLKSTFWKGVNQYLPNFHVEEDVRTNHFRTDWWANGCPTTLSLTVFTQSNFVADFLQAKCDFRWKNGRFVFLSPPLPWLGATYDVHLRFIGKRVADFLLVLIELFC